MISTEGGRAPPCSQGQPGYLQWGDVSGLQTFRALFDIEFDSLTLVERAKALTYDASMVDKHVPLVAIAGDESIALGVAEPLDSSLFFFIHDCKYIMLSFGRQVSTAVSHRTIHPRYGSQQARVDRAKA
jgi:hypothetical protein